MPVKHQFSGNSCGVHIDTGCSGALGPSVTALNPITTFDVSLSYVLFNMARIDVGYQNVSPELVDNQGKRQSIFASPDSSFYGNVSIYIDTILDKALNRDVEERKERRRTLGGHFGNTEN